MNSIILTKILFYLRKYWYIFVMFAAILITSFVAGSKSKMFKEILDEAMKSFEKEKKEIDKVSKEEKNKKTKIKENYDNAIYALENKYSDDKKKIKSEEKKRIKELTKKYSDDQEKLDLFLKDEFGLTRGSF